MSLLEAKDLPAFFDAVPFNSDWSPWPASSEDQPGCILHWGILEFRPFGGDQGPNHQPKVVVAAHGLFLFTDVENRLCFSVRAQFAAAHWFAIGPSPPKPPLPRILDLDVQLKPTKVRTGDPHESLRIGESFRWKGITWEVLEQFPELPDGHADAYDEALSATLDSSLTFSQLSFGPIFAPAVLEDFEERKRIEAETAERARRKRDHERFTSLLPRLDEVWSQIGGQEEAIAKVRRAIERSVFSQVLLGAHNLPRSGRGVVLYGPPGCGKTLIGNAVASALAVIFGSTASEDGFTYIKGSALFDKYHGVQEQSARKLFETARIHFKKHGYPAVLFFDEAESLFKRRSGFSDRYDYSSTLIPVFLNEMESKETGFPYVILATNLLDNIDPAVRRKGRIDDQIRIGRPDRTAAEQILRIHFKRRRFDSTAEEERSISTVLNLLFDESSVLYQVTMVSPLGEEEKAPFGLRELMSGAMLGAIAERAALLRVDACELDLEASIGITTQECKQAVKDTYMEQKGQGHAADLEDFAAQRGMKLLRAEKTR